MKQIFTSFLVASLPIFILSGCSKKDENNATAITGLPKVITSEITSITRTSAVGGGVVVSEGNSAVKVRGICYDTIQNPSIKNNHTNEGPGFANFTSNMPSLKQNTSYNVRAYATNEQGTAYGQQLNFKTAWDSGYAIVVTYTPGNITYSSVDVSGEITDSGESVVTERGFCWSTLPSPTISSSKIACGNGIGHFNTEITGLKSYTVYYLKAYAINVKGTFYGDQKQFTTKTYYTWLNVPGNYQGWAPTDTSTAIASIKNNERYEGYLWFPANTEFKFAKGSMAQSWGDNNGDGTLDPNGASILAQLEGYYYLGADLNSLYYYLMKTEWGVIGSATVNGWNSDLDMTYNAVMKVWTISTNLTTGEIKFRANDSWDLNYGDTGGDGSLDLNGDNIPVTTAGFYVVTLDLSKPIYRYSLVLNK